MAGAIASAAGGGAPGAPGRWAATWFAGGVPVTWQATGAVKVGGGLVLEAAWRTPGPVADGFFPCVYIVRLTQPAAEGISTRQWLLEEAAAAAAVGWPAHRQQLDDGSPALVVEVPASIGSDPLSSHVTISAFRVYARRGSGYYRLTFMASFKDYPAEEPQVAPVLGRFRGTP